jgi:hypothetical protein
LEILMDIHIGHFGMYEQFARPKMKAIMVALAAATAAAAGSEALANAVLRLAKSMNQSNIWALRNEIMELCEGAAAAAERTNLATESPVAETVAIGAGDSHAGSQSHQNADRQPAPPQPEAPEKEKP